MSVGLRPGQWVPSLRARLMTFLTIALLPLGIVAVLQTINVTNEASGLMERGLLRNTVRAADEQGAVLRAAIDTGRALGLSALALRDDPEACSQLMAEFIAQTPTLSFAGFVGPDGTLACNSQGQLFDYSADPMWRDFVADPTPSILSDPAAVAPGGTYFFSLTPFFDDDDGSFLGAQAVSMPHNLARILLAAEAQDIALALLGPDGQILATSTDMEDAAEITQPSIIPSALDIPTQGLLLRPQDDLQNMPHPVAVVPLIPGQVYVMGMWNADAAPLTGSDLNRTIPLFPIAMWVASLLVAFISINILVLRPLAKVRARMEQYGAGATPADPGLDKDTPAEIRQISDSYNDLLLRVARDQAVLEDNVREKTLLLREIHHRVKNNLQLIASLLNIQMRNVEDPKARGVLKGVQDRVLSLSSIHHALYTDDQFHKVNVTESLAAIVEGVGDVALPAGAPVEMVHDFAPVWLDPDQAMPLLLLATEAMTNAAKYVGQPDTGPARIECGLRQDDMYQVSFHVYNTKGSEMRGGSPAEGTALGSRLIAAFASQLGGEVRIDDGTRHHHLHLTFTNPLGQPRHDA